MRKSIPVTRSKTTLNKPALPKIKADPPPELTAEEWNAEISKAGFDLTTNVMELVKKESRTVRISARCLFVSRPNGNISADVFRADSHSLANIIYWYVDTGSMTSWEEFGGSFTLQLPAGKRMAIDAIVQSDKAGFYFHMGVQRRDLYNSYQVKSTGEVQHLTLNLDAREPGTYVMDICHLRSDKFSLHARPWILYKCTIIELD